MGTHEVLSPLPVRPRGRSTTVLATACCGVFFSFASVVVYTFGVFLKPLAAAFHWTRGELSLAFTMAALTIAACSPVIGHLLDRYPARKIVIPCTIVYGAALASLSLLTPHLWHLYAVFVLLGIVGNGTTQLGYARVVSTWFDENRGQALAAVMAGSGVGSMIFPPLAQELISRFGWRCAYALLGGAVLGIAVPLVLFFLREPTDKQSALRSTGSISGRPSVWTGPFLGIAAALLLFSFATNGLNTHWAAFLSDSGATPGRAAVVLSVAGFAALCGKLGTGYFLDRFRAGRVAALLLATCALGFGLVLVPYQWPLAIISATLIGIGMGAESDVVPYLLTRYFGLERFGVLYGYTWLVYAVAGATGPLVMGTVFDRSGSYRAVLIASLGMVLVASFLFFLLPGYESPEESF